MGIKDISPDQVILWEWSGWQLNLTIACTWLVMGILVLGGWLVTRKLTTGPRPSSWQHFLEMVIGGINEQIREISQQTPDRYLPFIGTLFLFIAVSNTLSIVPWLEAPTGSLSTTTALAICVFFAVPIFGIANVGWRAYLKQYLQPSPFMLPFNVIGELSRTLALAVRLFGNMMSGTKIVAILLAIVPFFVSIPIMALGLLTGLIQAYIFAILAMVYIASASQSQHRDRDAVDADASLSEEAVTS